MDIEELDQRTQRHQREIEALGARVTSMETNHSVNEVLMKAISDRLEKIESNSAWIIRLIVGAIILALLGLVVQGNIGVG